MNEILQQIDLIHAEAVKRKEHDDTLSPDNVYLRNKNTEHIANIVKLRQMVNRSFDKLTPQTTEDRGEYYIELEEQLKHECQGSEFEIPKN